jgi:hypothetical protein
MVAKIASSYAALDNMQYDASVMCELWGDHMAVKPPTLNGAQSWRLRHWCHQQHKCATRLPSWAG